MNRILIYCRESRDDNYHDFDRIETQAKMLIDFVKNENLGQIIDIILDDNKTGTNFKRLEPIKQKIINKEFDTFLCKDCSRIGRNLLESLKFIEFLDDHNINLIFLSEEYDEDIFPIKAWFNQLRAKDDSKKINDVLRQKMHDGTLLIKAPFGYTKINNNLIVNKETAKTVKLIFKLFLDGSCKSDIANKLNYDSIKTPSMYKPEYKKSLKWNTSQIDRILKNEIYTGTMIYNKKNKKSVSKKQYIKNDEKDWIKIKNHHEKIISIADFDMVSRILNKSTNHIRVSSNNPFTSVLYCGECGNKMYRKVRKNYKPYYICKTYNTYGNSRCTSKKVTEQKLFELITYYLTEKLKDSNIKNEILSFINSNNNMNQIESLDKVINNIKIKITNLYDDKQNEVIPDFVFTNKMKDYTFELDQKQKQKKSLQNYKKTLLDEKFIDDIVLSLDKHNYTNQEINLLFDKILVYDNNELDILFI